MLNNLSLSKIAFQINQNLKQQDLKAIFDIEKVKIDSMNGVEQGKCSVLLNQFLQAKSLEN